jgi:hypothetical protein
MVEEWNYFQLARWLGVPPWELARQDDFWRRRAQFYMDVEAGVMRARSDRLERRK